MSYDNYELRTGLCSICGEHIGAGFDHVECSKAKKEIYGDSNENKHPKKKISKKQTDYFGKLMSGK